MLESYITPILMGYINKYVKNIKPSDLQVSFWGGDAVLRNLELRLDVLEQELRYPLQIRSGRIRELVLHLPWNAILSKPVEVQLKDVEIVIKLKTIRLTNLTTKSSTTNLTTTGSTSSQPDPAIGDTSRGGGGEEEVTKESTNSDEAQQGYLQGYTNRILNNLTFHVSNLVVKVIEEESDLMMSYNIQLLKFGMTDENWSPSYICTDYCTGHYSLNKLLEVVDMVVHMQPIDSSSRVQPPTALKDPFLRKCSFTCRMRSLHHGKKLVGKSTCFLFDSLFFSADENQFSLFFYHLDWLLAMYYDGKKLKGRDDDEISKFRSSQSESRAGVVVVENDGPPSSQDAVSPSFEDVLLAGSIEDVSTKHLEGEGGDGGGGGGGGEGWGSWMWSFVAAEDVDGGGERGGGGGGGGEGKSSLSHTESSSISFLAKSITVNLKVTHQGRVPVFSTPRSRSRTVLNIVFSGCSARIDSVTSTQLFTVSVGIMAIQASAMGFCSCSSSMPSSWKSDPHEKVPVFSLGDAASCDTDLVLNGSLFDPEIQSRSPDQPPPLAEFLLAPRPEFTAVWFTYEYYDVGPEHPCEVCEERLLVGETNFLLSPDTLHRVTHFTSSFTESLKACPLFTDGMVRLGDPKAETSLKVTVGGGKVIVAGNTHYLPSFSSIANDQLPNTKSKSSTKSQTSSSASSCQNPNSQTTLPLLTVTLVRCTVSMTTAMYSGNASPEAPQRSQIRVVLSQLEVADGGSFSLAASDQTHPLTKKKIVSVPKMEIYSHSKTTGDGEKMQENDSLYVQLHIEEISCTVSAEQISKTGLVAMSWYTGSSPTKQQQHQQQQQQQLASRPSPEGGGHLHISVKEIELTRSVMVSFTFVSLTIDSMGAVLLCDSTRGRLCHALPVLYGPISTIHWNTLCAYNSSSSTVTSRDDDGGRDGDGERNEGSDKRMLEFFTAIPHDDCLEKSYPTLQLSIEGLTVCLDPTVMDFVKVIPSLFPWHGATKDGRHEQDVLMAKTLREREAPQSSIHSEDTAKEDVMSALGGVGVMADSSHSEGDILTKLKSYAIKVDIQPILIILPSAPLEEGLMSLELPEFPVLPALRDNPSMEALLLCLPQLSLTSAKSHVLEEPVPKTSTTGTLPWDCTLTQASLIALQRGGGGRGGGGGGGGEGGEGGGCFKPHYIVEPLRVAVSLADQQGGTGVAIHTDSIAASLSRNNVDLLSGCLTQIMEAISDMIAPKSFDGGVDSGVHSLLEDPLPPPPPTPLRRHPSHISSPALSTITTTATVTTLPAAAHAHTATSLLGTASSTSSLYSSNAFSSLWIQAIVTKITLTLLAPLPPLQKYSTRSDAYYSNRLQSLSAQSKSSSTASYTTPLTSPTTEMVNSIARPVKPPPPATVVTPLVEDCIQDEKMEEKISSEESHEARLTMEIDGVSIQYDLQEKCTDLIVKISAVGATLKTRNSSGGGGDDGGGGFTTRGNKCGRHNNSSNQWIPYLSSERLFSTKGSALPEELSEILANSSSAAIHLPQEQTVSSGSYRNFVILEHTNPRQSTHRAPRVRVKIQSFEAVVWLPVVGMVTHVFGSVKPQGEKAPHREEPGETGLWPTVEATVECCRLVLPAANYTSSLLCNVGRVTISHSLDYPTTDVRHIISNSAFRRLVHLSSEKKQPPLPAYQLDVLAVSLWGIHREVLHSENGEVLLYAGSSDVRMTYTPALYWRPTVAGTSHKPAILACGHCVEVNFRTDLDLILGPEQVECIATILDSNKIISTQTRQTTPQATPTNQTSPPTIVVPFKGLLSATAVRLTLVSSHSSNEEEEDGGGGGGGGSLVDSGSDTSEYVFSTLHGLDSAVVPLAQLQIFNILCGLTVSSSGGCLIESSCFNMAIGCCGGDSVVCSYSDLVDVGITSSLMDSLLLETQRGRSHNKREIPPSVITMAIDLNQHKPPAVTVEISRPIKITLIPHLIRKFSEFGDSILKSVSKRNGTEPEIPAPEKSSTNQDPLLTVTDPQNPFSPETTNNQQDQSTRHSTGVLDTSVGDGGGNALRLKLKVMQLLIEYQVSTRHLCQPDERGGGLLVRPLTLGERVGMERERVGVGEEEEEEGSSIAEEGFILVWDYLDLVYPNVSDSTTCVSGELHLDGLQLLSIQECNTSPVLLPVQFNCSLVQHFPSFPLDLGYMTANVSCGLLEIRMSRELVDLANKAVCSLTHLSPYSQESDQPTSELKSETVEKKEGEKDEEDEDVVHFHDDLRAGDFTYVRDSDVVTAGYSVRPGEVYFSLGEQDKSTTTSMSWHYYEPRAVTKLFILPVPFSFTSESDAPIQIKVGCSLDYWDEDCQTFSVLCKFHLSETTPTEVVVSRVIGSRKWRISIVEVEWEDEEEGEIFVSSSSDMVDEKGEPVPISSILSPVLLAGGTCVDSFFSPRLVPVLDLCLTCHELQIKLLHNPPVISGWFGEYEVSWQRKGPQELLKLHTQHLTCHAKRTRNADTTFRVDGQLSIDFVDFLDHSWRVALHPTHLHLHFNLNNPPQAKFDKPESAADSKEPHVIYDIILRSSPSVMRLSQGFIHTLSLSLHTLTVVDRGGGGGGIVGEGVGGGGGEGGGGRGVVGGGVAMAETGTKKQTAVLNHIILCNNTLQDLHFGQVSTDEVMVLRSGQCMGYSWRNNKISPQAMQLCSVTDGEWKWTKPFSLCGEGTEAVEVNVGKHKTLVNISISNIGGLQRTVTFAGNWTFSSSLPFPLHLTLVSTSSSSSTSSASSASSEQDPSREQESDYVATQETFILAAESSLKSLVLPETLLSGVRVKSLQSRLWSELYPIHSTSDEWSKPQLLTEIEYCSGQRVNLWYSIKPVNSSKGNPIGSEVMFSPLFALCNHLPFDLIMVVTETNATGPAPISLPECVLNGRGERTILCGLLASTWYHLSFKQSGSDEVSEPTVPLSTHFLIHLPFSTGLVKDSTWPYEDDEKRFDLSGVPVTSSAKVTLPLNDGSHCCLHAVLERDPNNTITLHLQPETLVVNHSSLTLKLISDEEEDESENETKETLALCLTPEDVRVLPYNKFRICVEWEGKPLQSETLTTWPEEDKEQEDQSTTTKVVLNETGSSDDKIGVSGYLTLDRSLRGSLLVLGLRPTYVFHNDTSYDLEVLSHISSNSESGGDLSDLSDLSKLASVVKCVPPQASGPLIFCSQVGMDESVKETIVTTLSLRTASKDKENDDRCWSLPLSLNFVRRSFALLQEGGDNLKAVLTMHEHKNTIYTVASLDPSPRLLIQNYTLQELEVVEDGALGIHAVPQLIPAGQEVVYEPPTFAKQYPLVLDGESEKSLQTRKKMEKAAVKFRRHSTVDQSEEEEIIDDRWSEPFTLAATSDCVLSVPGGDGFLLSSERIGTTLKLLLLPTGRHENPSLVPTTTSSSSGVSGGGRNVKVKVEVNLEQVVVCVEDEVTEEFDVVREVLQVVVDGTSICVDDDSKESRSFDLKVESFHINNMLEGDKGDFAVTVIPRAHHFRRASLIDSEPPPLASLSVIYNPLCSNVIELLKISVQPLTLQLEDNLLNRLRGMLNFYGSPGTLRPPTMEKKGTVCGETPGSVLAEAERDVVPLAVTRFVIESAAFYLNARISLRVLLSCSDSPFHFARYELQHVYSNWTELSQTVASRYVMSTIAHVGWLVGSLELIGSPGTLLQNVGRGLRDLVTLPYQGLTRSPTWFLLGIGQGTMSFVTHLSSGALGSITGMASSISHNMERLSLDPHHISYQTQQRQERPATHFTTGLISGASSLGLSLMSAVAGIVEQPMQSYHQIQGPTSPGVAARSILKGVGKGLLGAVTKPVGGVMELVSQTGLGLMHGTGLASRMCHKQVKLQSFTGSLKRTELPCSSTACAIKLGGEVSLLFSTSVTCTSPNSPTKPALLLLTNEMLYLFDPTTNTFQQTFSVSEFTLAQQDSQAGNLEEAVELEIVSVASRGLAEADKEDEEEALRFHKVEYFLRQSCEKRSSVESSLSVIPAGFPASSSPTLDWSAPGLDLANEEADTTSEVERSTKAVRVSVATHHAVQLLSLFNSLSSLSLTPNAVFPVHRKTKSESFMSATSN